MIIDGNGGHISTFYMKQPPEDREWRMKHEDCPGHIFGSKECRLSKNYCTKKNCIFMYFREGTIDALFDI